VRLILTRIFYAGLASRLPAATQRTDLHDSCTVPRAGCAPAALGGTLHPAHAADRTGI